VSLNRPSKTATPEEIREWRKNYMREYRKGVIKPCSIAKSRNSRLPGMQLKEIAYYLEEDLFNAVCEFGQKHNLNRNSIVVLALEKFFGHRRYKYEIKISDVPFTEKRFLHNSIDAKMYIHLDEYTRTSGKYKRQIKMTSVIEQAIRELVLCSVQYPHGIKLDP
jgi:hypothetical protein